MELIQTIAMLCLINMPAKNQLFCQQHHLRCVDSLVEKPKQPELGLDVFRIKYEEKEALKICIERARVNMFTGVYK